MADRRPNDPAAATSPPARPTTDQVPFDVNTNLIVEFYR